MIVKRLEFSGWSNFNILGRKSLERSKNSFLLSLKTLNFLRKVRMTISNWGNFLSRRKTKYLMTSLFNIFTSIVRSSAKFKRRWKRTKRSWSCFWRRDWNFLFSSSKVLASWVFSVFCWYFIFRFSRSTLQIFSRLISWSAILRHISPIFWAVIIGW